MTLRARLLSVTMSMAVLAVLGMLAINVNSLTGSGLRWSQQNSESVARQLRRFLVRRIEQQTTDMANPPTSIGANKKLWKQIVAGDPELTAMVDSLIGQSPSLVEINIAGEDSVILVSSNRYRLKQAMTAHETLSSLRDASPLGRLMAILTSSHDYETRESVGITDKAPPVFTVQVLASTVFIRDYLKPSLVSALAITASALAAAVVLAYWLARLALRPLTRVGHIVDAIVRGEPVQLDEPEAAGAELAIIESKLNILGEQFRGARQGGELAVSRRLTAISSLTGRVAHEIKNPLNAIALRLELLRTRIATEAPDADPEIQILTQEVTRLDRVVKTFLDFTRPVELALEPQDVSVLAEQVTSFLQPQAEAKGIRVELTAPGHPVIVRADADLLKQAIMNIAVNAIEAMDQGGELKITVTRAGQNCRLSISDTGPGIPPEQKDRIFDLYFTTKPSGTGIGLAMTFRSVQLHGGTIAVTSESGKGTEFLIELPLASPSVGRRATA